MSGLADPIQMLRGLFIFSVMILGIVFLIVPDAPPKDFFIFAEMKVTPEWYVYYLMESIIVIIFALYIRNESSNFRGGMNLFLILQVVELADFILTYNMTWFTYHQMPVTFNVIKVLIFGLYLAYEFLHHFLTKRILT